MVHNAGLFVCLAAAYAVAVYCRLGVVELHPDLSAHDVTTADAYGWLTAVNGLGVSRDHLLAVIARLLVESGVLSLETLALYGPVFTAALAAPLLMYWGWRKVDPAAGIFAGILGIQLPVVYARTSFGYFDSDAVVVPLLIAVTLVFEAWVVDAERRIRAGKGQGRSLLAWTAGMGLALYLSGQVHVFFLFNAVALVLVAAWFHPLTRVPCLFVLLTAILGPVGLLLCLFLVLGLQELRHRYPEWHRLLSALVVGRPLASLAVLSAIIVSVVAAAEAAGWIEVLARIRVYVYQPLMGWLGGEVTSVGVGELSRVSPKEILRLLSGNVYLSVLGIVAVVVALRMNRSFWYFLFPLLLGLSAPLTGIRFTLFGSLVVVLGAAVVLSKLAENLVRRLHLKAALLGVLGSFYAYQLFQVYAADPPEAYGDPGVKEALMSIRWEAGANGCDLILTSWGQGYLASYFTRLPAVLDGSSYPFEAVAAYRELMASRQVEDMRRHLCDLIEHQQPFIEDQTRRFECSEGWRPDIDLYWLITWDNVLEASRWEGGGSQRDSAVTVTGLVPDAVKQSGRLQVQNSSRSLGSMTTIAGNGIDARTYPGKSKWHLVVNEIARKGVMVSEDLYESYFLRAFVGRDMPGWTRIGSNTDAVIASARLDDFCPRITETVPTIE